MVSSETTNLPITYIPPSATGSHGFNHLVSRYLFYVGQACDHNCTAFIDNNPVKTFKSTEVTINALLPPIIQGHCNAPPKPLSSVPLQTNPPTTNKVNATIHLLSIQYRISF